MHSRNDTLLNFHKDSSAMKVFMHIFFPKTSLYISKYGNRFLLSRKQYFFFLFSILRVVIDFRGYFLKAEPSVGLDMYSGNVALFLKLILRGVEGKFEPESHF